MTDQPFRSGPGLLVPPVGRGALARSASELVPGLALCGAVSAAAVATQWLEVRLLGRPWLEPLVLAILLGAALRTLWRPPPRLGAGIAFGAKQLLEAAVTLLGASVSIEAIAAVGPGLVLGIVAAVALVIPTSFLVGRLLGLPPRMAVLVACGNAICGNSAIAAVAPTIGARSEEVAASIAFTAVLGVAVVLGLPAVAALLGLNAVQFGTLAGLTVYATPQVLAAAASGGSVAVQVGTVVKLVRVLLLGPVVLGLSLATPRLRGDAPARAAVARRPGGLRRAVPWFVLAFFALAALRGLGAIPTAVVAPAGALANALTVLSMAALGLGVDVRVVARAGGRVIATAVLSIAALGVVALALLRVLHV